MIKTVEIDLEFQDYIPVAPASPKELYSNACSADEITINTWRDTWIRHFNENHAKVGGFSDKGVGALYNLHQHKPVIIVGSGPSLKGNIEDLKQAKSVGIPVVSCLHNFHYLEDNGVEVDYYVTLDAGEVTVEEVAKEGGTRPEEEYWALTKERTLLAFVGTHPKLLERWQGKVLFFNSPIPDQAIVDEMAKTERFNTFVSTGGNVLGACFYLAKAVMGASPVIFVGADFAFSYTKKFHAWDSKYDSKVGQVMRVTDVFGNKVATWSSYYNFKCWFDSRVMVVPGFYINATEGGIFGAYAEGNIAQVKQMRLSDVIKMYGVNAPIKEQCDDPSTDKKILLF